MAMFLRQSTASQEVSLGYFLDSTDGNTEETGLTIANTDIKIRKGGLTTIANKNSGGATHISNGIYSAVLDATDTNTLGDLVIYCHVTGALATKQEYTVLPAASYDALITNGLNDLSAAQVNTECDTALTDYDPPTNAEMNARTVTSATYATAANLSTVDAIVDSILVDTADLQANQGNWLTAAGFSTFNAATDAVANVTLVGTTTTNTDMRGTDGANTTTPTNISVSDILTTQMTESYAADGIAPTLAQAIFLTMQNQQDFAFAGTTQTVFAIDGTTTAATYTFDSITPTSKTRAS